MGSKDGRQGLSQEQSRTGEEKAVDAATGQGRAGQHRTDRDREISHTFAAATGEKHVGSAGCGPVARGVVLLRYMRRRNGWAGTHQGYSPSHRVLDEEHLSQARRVLFLGRACSLDSSPSAAMAEKSLIDLLSPSPSASPSTSMRPGLGSVSIMSAAE